MRLSMSADGNCKSRAKGVLSLTRTRKEIGGRMSTHVSPQSFYIPQVHTVRDHVDFCARGEPALLRSCIA